MIAGNWIFSVPSPVASFGWTASWVMSRVTILSLWQSCVPICIVSLKAILPTKTRKGLRPAVEVGFIFYCLFFLYLCSGLGGRKWCFPLSTSIKCGSLNILKALQFSTRHVRLLSIWSVCLETFKGKHTYWKCQTCHGGDLSFIINFLCFLSRVLWGWISTWKNHWITIYYDTQCVCFGGL